MAIQQTKRQSDLEKRLQLLRRQVYGKNPDRSDEIRKSENLSMSISSDPPTHRPTDLTYLHQDLLKILIFASFAIGGQAILFFLLKNHILNINFF